MELVTPAGADVHLWLGRQVSRPSSGNYYAVPTIDRRLLDEQPKASCIGSRSHQNEPLSVDVCPPDTLADARFCRRKRHVQLEKSVLQA